MIVALQSISASDYKDWWQIGVRDYAADKVANGTWTADESLSRSEKSFRELLPQGRETEGQYVYSIRLKENDQRVGFIWLGRYEGEGYIYDLYIAPEHRRCGYASEAMTCLEHEAREYGFSTISLHVFGSNIAARDLYEQLGYGITDLTMRKKIPAS